MPTKRLEYAVYSRDLTVVHIEWPYKYKKHIQASLNNSNQKSLQQSETNGLKVFFQNLEQNDVMKKEQEGTTLLL